MKKLWTLMAMVAVFASCSQDETDSPLNTYTLTGYADVESRTAFGTPGNAKIPFQWSAGDYIYNGTNKSNAISNGGSSATFTFNGTSTSSEVYYNIAGTTAKQANVKTTQTVGNLGTNGDFGYGTVNNGSFTLNHATSYLWFDVTSSHNSSVTLQSVKVSADVNIAGKAIWNGTSLGSVSEGNKSIELSVNEALSSTNDNVWAMVVLPNLASKSFKVTYKLKVGNNTRYYTETITGKQNFTSGKTQKVSLEITNNTPLTDYVELRILTFEDEDAKFESYYLDYYNNKQISTWSDLIAEDQYGDYILGYGTWAGNCIPTEDSHYSWYDENNTFLAHNFPLNYDSYCFAGGGHAISNYASNNYSEHGNYMYQLTVYNKNANGMVKQGGGHNGSNNFAMHYGYYDDSSWNQTTENDLPAIYFKDDKPRVIDHLWVCLSTYEYYCLYEGNGLTDPLGDGDYVIIEAIGHKEDGTTSKISTRVADFQNGVIDDWTKWDLSALGKVIKVHFNIIGTNDNGYGFSQPAYFAYDDIAVQFTE